MKRLKITSVILSVAMLCSLLMPSIVLADEAAAPSETQATESADKKEPAETKKPEPKETTKPKETEAPKETETVKETEAPKETEAAKETELPKETEKSETEAPKETTETEAPKETEKPEFEEPKETEKIEPEETKEPEVTETETPETPEKPEETEPSESDIPKETASGKPKMAGTIADAKISEDGILTWTAAENVYVYEVYISGVWGGIWENYTDDVIPTTFDLKPIINRLIKNKEIDKSSPYKIELFECDESWEHTASWTGSFTYDSPVDPIVVGTLKNTKVDNGILSWDAYESAINYKIYIAAGNIEHGYDLEAPTFELNREIDYLIKCEYIGNVGDYKLRVLAYDEDDLLVAEWKEDYHYESKAKPIVIGTFKNAKIANGILSWDAFEGAKYYRVRIETDDLNTDYEADELSFELNKEIDWYLKGGYIENAGKYHIILSALDEDDLTLAEWEYDYIYKPDITPIEVGDIKNAVYEDGILTWDKYPGAESYEIAFGSFGELAMSSNYCELGKHIEECIANGDLDKSDKYTVNIVAYNHEYLTIGYCSVTFTYKPSDTPFEEGKINAKINSNGILYWTAYPGTTEYSIYFNGCYLGQTETSVDLKEEIDFFIKLGELEKNSPYQLKIEALDSNEEVIATWSGEYAYDSNATVIEVGSIKNAKITDGVLTWDKYDGTAFYYVTIADNEDNEEWSDRLNTTSFNLAGYIDSLVNEGKLAKKNSYTIGILARDEEEFTIADWYDDYSVGTVVKDISSATVTGIVDKTYTGEEILQTFSVSLNGTVLKEDTDYTVGYENIINVGTAKVTITGKGDYTGKIEKTFKINAYDICDASVAGVGDRFYCGGEVKLALVVTAGFRYLSEETDYTVSYADNIKVGTAKLTITGKGNYTGQIERTYKIKSIDIGNSQVSGYDDQPYTGSEVKVPIVLKLNENKLEEGVDYTLSYADNVEVGTATITITGIGNCSGSFSVTFKITQAPNTLSVQSGKKSIRYKKLRKKTQTISLPKVAKVSNAQGAVSYRVLSAKKGKSKKSYKSKFKVNASTGVIKIKKKKLKKGTYTVTCSVTASGNDQYAGVTKTFTVKVKVK